MSDGYGFAIGFLFFLVFLIIILIIIGGLFVFFFGLNRFEAFGVTGINTSTSNNVSVLGNQVVILLTGPTGTNTLTLNSDSGNTTGKTFIITNISGSTVNIVTGNQVSFQNVTTTISPSGAFAVILPDRQSAEFVFNGTNTALFIGFLHNS